MKRIALLITYMSIFTGCSTLNKTKPNNELTENIKICHYDNNFNAMSKKEINDFIQNCP